MFDAGLLTPRSVDLGRTLKKAYLLSTFYGGVNERGGGGGSYFVFI